MNTVSRIAVSSHAKTTTLAFALALCTLVSTVSTADLCGNCQITERGTV